MIGGRSKIGRLSEVLRLLMPMGQENQLRLDKKIRMEFNFHSNHLEGNTLTYGETELLLLFERTKSGEGHPYRDLQEMKAHDAAFSLIKQWAVDKERRLTEADIKHLNLVLLVEPFFKNAITTDGKTTSKLIQVGDYKKTPNSVRLPDGTLHSFTSPENTPIEMGELIEWFREQEETNSLPPVVLATLLHYQFVCIHPFDDGNGRIARLMMNYVLLKNELPPVIIKSGDKAAYFQALQEADTGDMMPFVDYITRQLVWSLEISIKAAKGESINEPGDLDKKLVQLKKKLGEDPAKKSTLKKDSVTVRAVMENSIIPLANAWEMKLKEFDAIFFDRNMNIQFDNHQARGKDLRVTMKQECENNLYPNLDRQLPVRICIICDPRGIRRIIKEAGLNGGQVEVFFFENTYELSFTGRDKPISKLYDEFLSEDELVEIVEGVGNWLVDVIERTYDAYK